MTLFAERFAPAQQSQTALFGAPEIIETPSPPAVNVQVDGWAVRIRWTTLPGGVPAGFWRIRYVLPNGAPGIFDLPGNVTTYGENFVPPGTYSFMICGANEIGEGKCSEIQSFTIRACDSLTGTHDDAGAGGCSIPSPPSNLRFAQNGSNVTLAWNPSSCCQDTAPTNTYVVVVNGRQEVVGLVTEKTLTNLSPGQYTVTVLARNASGDSALSNPVTFTVGTCTAPPAVPMVGVAVKGSYVALIWSRSPGDLDRRETYDIEVGGAIVVSKLAVASIDGNLNPGVYIVRIRAVNDCGSTWSESVKVVVESPRPEPPPGGAVTNVQIWLTGCQGSADPLPGWKNCTGRVEMSVNRVIQTGWIQVTMRYPVAGSFYVGQLQVTPGRMPGRVTVNIRNGYVSQCPDTNPYHTELDVWDGRSFDPNPSRIQLVPVTMPNCY